MISCQQTSLPLPLYIIYLLVRYTLTADYRNGWVALRLLPEDLDCSGHELHAADPTIESLGTDLFYDDIKCHGEWSG